MNIVLIEPEIPGNTGNIARLCAATGSHLHLIRPLGFSVDDRHLKRAGLDYWHLLQITYYDSFREFRNLHSNHFYFLSTKAAKNYIDVSYTMNDFLVFGRESSGIPLNILEEHWNNTIRLPMIENARSLNLSNAVSIVVYEALRQNNFPLLKTTGAGLLN